MVVSAGAKDEGATRGVGFVRAGVVGGSVSVESDASGWERARDRVLDQVKPRHFEAVDSDVTADRLVRGDLPLMAAGDKPEATVFDAGLL